MNLKRTLTSIAAASIVLGTMAPVAMAATSYPSFNTWAKKTISYNGTTLASPNAFVTNNTTYFPIYYLMVMLKNLNPSASVNWDGTNLSINFPGANPNGSGVVLGNAGIYLNGTLVQKFTKIVTFDHGTKIATTFAPIYPLFQVMQQAGFAVTWNGDSASVAPVAPTTMSPALSALTITGQTAGDGQTATPATVLNGSAMTLSTTLTDASGNAVANTQVTFNVNAQTATVMNGAYAVTGTKDGSGMDYAVFTDASGKASITVSAPAGTTVAYSVKASAPYQVNGSTVATKSVTLEFVAPGQNGIAPYAPTSGVAYMGTIGTAVPVTVTLAPVNGVVQSNVALNFLLPTSTSTAVYGTYFTNASGANLGSQVQTVYTNSVGQATVWVNNTAVENDQVTVTDASNNQVAVTFLSFSKAGIPAQTSTITASPAAPNAGDKVTLTGSIEDASGNAVPGAQLLLWGNNYKHNAYVSGSTTTNFPNVSISSGVPATSTYGEVLTADAAGNFSATVTDSTSETDSYNFWAVNNGVVAGSAALSSISFNYALATTLAAINAYPLHPSAPAVGDGSAVTGLQQNAGTDAVAYFVPMTATAELTASSSTTYQLSAPGGTIDSINGTALTNKVAATTLTVTYSAGTYSYSVPGQLAANPIATTTTPLFSVGFSDSANGSVTLTATSGSVSATAQANFIAGTPALVANFPAYVAMNAGQFTTVTYQVQDINGNAVANSATTLAFDNTATSPLYITSVNGVTLTQPAGLSGASVPTPIALGVDPATYDVSIAGVVGFTHTANTVTLYTDSKGDVTLTLQAGGVSYWTGTGGTPSNGTATAGTGNASTAVYTYGGSGTNTNGYQVYVGNTAPWSGARNNTQVGNLSW